MILVRLNTSKLSPYRLNKRVDFGKIFRLLSGPLFTKLYVPGKKERECDELQHSGRQVRRWARVSEADLEAATFNRTSTNEHQRARLESRDHLGSC